MKLVKFVALVMVLTGIVALNAQEPCMFWFSLSDTDPTPVNEAAVQQSDTITLHAWISAYQPSWERIDGVTFPICFDTNYLEFIEAAFDTANLGIPNMGYSFYGVNCPSGCLTGGENPSQVMWFMSVCQFTQFGCLPADGTPIHLGYVTFHVLQTPPANGVEVIDTCMYPPSNTALMNDETGTQFCTPVWTPFAILSTGVAEKDVPVKFFLGEFKPNPFSRVTSISFGLPRKSEVNVSVYNVSGRLVRTLVSGVKEAGTYTIEWNGKDAHGRELSSGAYFVRMITDEFNTTKRLLLLR